MLADFEFPIIETYAQLAWLAVALTGFLYVGSKLWGRARHAQPGATLGRDSSSHAGLLIRRSKSNLAVLDFAKLETVIAHTADRASTIVEQQQAAAQKIDSTEMAINRMMTDLSAVMSLPRAQPRPEFVVQHSRFSDLRVVAPSMPLPPTPGLIL